MAGEPYLIVSVGEDAETIALGDIRDRIERAVAGGVPLDTLVKIGYSAQFLRESVHVINPVDVKQLRFSELRSMANRINAEDSARAWAEIERRIEAFGLAGDD